MTDLPDVNVWLALADGNHVHHAAAQHYWQHQAAGVVAFCRVSMLGFLRLSTHRGVLSRPLTAAEACDIYHAWRRDGGVGFVDEPPAAEALFRELTCQPGFPRHLWTDAWLAACARNAGCRVVSFDADFKRIPDLDLLLLRAAR